MTQQATIKQTDAAKRMLHPAIQLLSMGEAAKLYGVASKTFERWTRDPAAKMPQPVKRPGGSLAWRLSEIIEHIESLERAERKERISRSGRAG